MPILCEPATSSGRLLYTIGGDVRAVDSLTETARLLDRDPTEFLVVIGPKAPTNEALAFAASLRMSRPAVGVILTRHEVDVALLTSALQSGVREVVRAGDDAALAAACPAVLRGVAAHGHRRPHRPGYRAPRPDRHRVRGQGRLRQDNARDQPGRGAGHGDRSPGVHRRPGPRVRGRGDQACSSTRRGPWWMRCRWLGHLDTTGAASLLTRYRPGLEVLLAPVTPGDAEKITPALVGELLTVLRSIFDYVVVDTPAQFSEHVLIAMDSLRPPRAAHHPGRAGP